MSRYGRRAYDSDSDDDDAAFGRSYYGQNSGFGFLPSTNSPYSNSYGSRFGANDSDSDSSDDDSGFGARGRRKTTRRRKKPKATHESESESESESDSDDGSSFGKKKKRKSGMSTKRRKMLKEVMDLHHNKGKTLKQAWKIVKKKKKYQ